MMKLAKDVLPRTYELTYLIPASLTEAEKTKLNDEMAALIKRHQGEITTTEDWGKKKLAYKIKHDGKFQTEANYSHFVISMQPSQAQPLEKDIYLNTQVIRHLLIVVDEKADKSSKKVEDTGAN